MGRWLALLADRESEKNAKCADNVTDETDKTQQRDVSSVLSVPTLSVSEKFSGDESAVVIDLSAHLTRAQRIADRKNAEAAQRRHTDRWCRCGNLASLAWRVAGRKIWRCEGCETEGA